MVSRKIQLVVLLLIVGLLTACGSPAATATQAPAAAKVQAPVSASATPAIAAAATDAPVTSPDAVGVSFTHNIMPVFQNSCINCHGGDKIEKDLSLRTYADMMIGSENGPVIVPGNAATSKLAQLVANHKMPKRGAKLTDAQVQLIVDWINQGAQDN